MPYETMMYAGIASTAVFLTISAVVFIQFDIYSVIGFLTGSTARRAIREMENEAASGKTGSLLFSGRKNKSTKPGKTEDIEDENGLTSGRRKRRGFIFGRNRKDAFYLKKSENAERSVLHSEDNALVSQPEKDVDETELLPENPDMSTMILRPLDSQRQSDYRKYREISNRTTDIDTSLRCNNETVSYVQRKGSTENGNPENCDDTISTSGVSFQILEHVVIVHTEEAI